MVFQIYLNWIVFCITFVRIDAYVSVCSYVISSVLTFQRNHLTRLRHVHTHTKTKYFWNRTEEIAHCFKSIYSNTHENHKNKTLVTLFTDAVREKKITTKENRDKSFIMAQIYCENKRSENLVRSENSQYYTVYSIHTVGFGRLRQTSCTFWKIFIIIKETLSSSEWRKKMQRVAIFIALLNVITCCSRTW